MPITVPIIAGESTLSLTRTDLRAFIGAKMSGGDDYNPASWDTKQTYQAASVLQSAERMFYAAHDWSFLKPWFNLTFEPGVESYDFPADYGGMIGSIIYVDQWSRCQPILQSDMGTVEYDLGLNGPGDRGFPTRYAVEILPMSGESQGQRHAIRFNRRPSQACKLRGQYYVHPYDLSETRVYPLGGPAHAECLKWACAAMVEVEINEIADGPGMAHFQRMLAASIRIDLRNAPTHLGVMGSKRLVRPHDDPPIFTGDVVYRP